MKLLALLGSNIYVGTSRGQIPGYREGTFYFSTDSELTDVWTSDLLNVLGPVEDWGVIGFTTQGGQLVPVTDAQISELRLIGQRHLKEQTERQAKADAMVTYEDINDMLRKNGNAAAAE